MFKIGTFSKLTQVSIRMLRYYDKVGLFKPAKIDILSEHRLYSLDQIPKLTRIIFLRDCGFKVSEIATIIDQSTDYLNNQFNCKANELEKLIQDTQNKIQKIKLAQKELLYTNNNNYNHILIKSIPSLQVISLKRELENYFEEPILWNELFSFTQKHNIKTLKNSFSIYYDTKTGIEVEVCVEINQQNYSLVDNIKYKKTNYIPLAASTMVYGDFKNISGAYLSFENWIKNKSQYKIIGNTRQIVHRGPWNEKNSEKYLIELQIPVGYK